MVSFKASFFRNVLISGGYNYLAQGLTFLSSIIIARLLSPENYGLVGLITVFTGFVSVFSDSGISLAIIKSDYGYSYHKALESVAIIIGVMLFILTAIMAYPIALFYKNSSLIYPTIVLASTFVFRSLSLVRGALLSKALAFGYLGKVVLINTSITILLTIVLAYYGAQHWAIIIPQIVSAVLTFILYERRLGFKFKLYPFRYVRIAYRYTKTLIGSLIGFNLVNYWARNSDNLLVGKFYGVNDLGIYNRAYSLLMFPLSLITGLMGTVLYPSLKKLKNEGGDIYAEYMYVLKIISFLVFPISFILLLFPDLLVHLLWGDKWKQVAPLLPYFGILIFSQPLLSSVGNFLVLQEKEKTLMYSGWIGAVLTISSICFGAMFSLIAIVQCYALGFIIFVLPFNIIYIFYHTLQFRLKMLLKFWLPVILISISLWLSCFFNIRPLLYFSLAGLFICLIINFANEIKTLIKKISF